MTPKLEFLEYDVTSGEMVATPEGRYVERSQVDQFLAYMDSVAQKWFQVALRKPEGIFPVGLEHPDGIRIMPQFPSAIEAVKWAKLAGVEYDIIIWTSTMVTCEVDVDGRPIDAPFSRS